MKIVGFNGIVRNDQFVDVMFDVTLTGQDKATFEIDNDFAVLCLTYDIKGKCIIVGVLDGADIVLTNLTSVEISQVNYWIDQCGIMDEIKEIVDVIAEKVS